MKGISSEEKGIRQAEQRRIPDLRKERTYTAGNRKERTYAAGNRKEQTYTVRNRKEQTYTAQKQRRKRSAFTGIFLPLSFLMALLLLQGCGEARTADQETVREAENPIEIGMCFDSFVIERWQRDRDVFVSTAKEYGAEVNVQNANGDVEEQIRQIEYFIDRKADVIVIISIDGERLSDVVRKARGQGIKVICYDRLVKNADADLYISFDNRAVGTMMAQALADSGLKNGRIIMLQGPVEDQNVAFVKDGFMEVAKDNGMEIIDSINSEGWRPEIAGNYIYDNPAVVNMAEGIMCGNDSLASQVVHALSERRLAGKIAVVGQDADLEACQRIVEGTQVMTVYKPVEKLAQAAAEYAIRLARGEDLSQADADAKGPRQSASNTEEPQPGPVDADARRIQTIDDGTYEIPYVVLTPVSVNRDNINEVIIGSGFHLKEDVYLNVPSQMPD